jgi:hypothetical protein
VGNILSPEVFNLDMVRKTGLPWLNNKSEFFYFEYKTSLVIKIILLKSLYTNILSLISFQIILSCKSNSRNINVVPYFV